MITKYFFLKKVNLGKQHTFLIRYRRANSYKYFPKGMCKDEKYGLILLCYLDNQLPFLHKNLHNLNHNQIVYYFRLNF